MLEFDLIDRLRGRIRPRQDVLLGVGDDAALLQPPQGEPLVVTTDTLNAGVHFPVETHPEDLGWKTLAVSVSDLAAMGATPRWCTLSLSLLQVDMAWIDAFADGFFELADLHGLVLVGGDTTYGPLATSVTAIGCVPPGMALRRDGACIGDDIWVTGRPGEAAAALAMWCAGMLDITKCAPDPRCEILRQRLLRPTPPGGSRARFAGIGACCGGSFRWPSRRFGAHLCKQWGWSSVGMYVLTACCSAWRSGMRRRFLLGNWPVVMIMSFVLQQHRSVVPQYRTCAPLWVLR